MKARAEGEIAANPLGDLSPFSPPCVDFHFTPSLCRLHFRNSRECLRFLLRRSCGSVPSSKTVECCKTIFFPPWTFFSMFGVPIVVILYCFFIVVSPFCPKDSDQTRNFFATLSKFFHFCGKFQSNSQKTCDFGL